MKEVFLTGFRAYVKPEAVALSLLEDGALLMSSPAVTPGGGSGGSGGISGGGSGSGGFGSGVGLNPFNPDNTDTEPQED